MNNVNITNIYRNARVGNGITGVNANDFAQGRFTNMARVRNDQLRQATLVKGAVPLAPTTGSLRVSDRQVAPIARSSAYDGKFFSRNQAPRVNRVPFAEQQRALAQINQTGTGRSDTARSDTVRSETARETRGFAVSPSQAAGAGTQRGTAIQSRMPSAGGASPATTEGNSWKRFGAAPPSAGGRPSAQSSVGEFNRVAPSAQSGNSPNAGLPRGEQPRVNQGDSGWRRFGAPSRTDVQPAPETRNPAQNPDRSWRAPGDRPQPSVPRTSAPERTGGSAQRFQSEPSNGGFSRFGSERPTVGSGSPGTDGASYASPRSDNSRWSNPSYDRPRQQPLQISPPVVREREAPRYAPSYGGGGGGGSRPAPQVSAPRSYGGGGGGGGRSAPSGGGGGGRSGGGSARSGGGGRNR